MCKLYLFFILVIERVGRYIHTWIYIQYWVQCLISGEMPPDVFFWSLSPMTSSIIELERSSSRHPETKTHSSSLGVRLYVNTRDLLETSLLRDPATLLAK